MAVGKGSMARASKAAAKKGDVSAAVIANPDEKVMADQGTCRNRDASA